jgi:dihydroorotate dehydrogenase electron transfer subunit
LSDYATKVNTLRTTAILSIKNESPTVKTFTLKDDLCSKARPGQFLMLWIPGIDEIPLSILNTSNHQVQFSVKVVGDATRHLHDMQVGELLGVRGPFGTSFTETRGRALLIGGGTGTAPLLFLAKRLAAKTDRLSYLIGAKTKSELVFLNEFDALCTDRKSISTTEDGSYGLHCLATEPLDSLLEKQQFNMIYACGPEQMVRKIFDMAEKHELPMEASLERLMRCGIGLCGSCMIGKFRVCKDGPVFRMAQLSEMKNELGISKLGFDGSRIDV